MSQSTANSGGTSSRSSRHAGDVAGSCSSSTASPRYAGESGGGGGGEWETKEALGQRELEEARARAAQMEKTMRWWSDCTANWREKWSKVRNERNKAREEAKTLRNKLEAATKDSNNFKRESQELLIQNDGLRKELEKARAALSKDAIPSDGGVVAALRSDAESKRRPGSEELDETAEEVGRVAGREDGDTPADEDIEEYVLRGGAAPRHAVELYKDRRASSLDREETAMLLVAENRDTSAVATNSPELLGESPVARLDRDIARLVDETNRIREEKEKRESSSSFEIDNDQYPMTMEKMSMLNLRLEEASRTISAEREEKWSLHRGMEKLRSETMRVRERCEELERSRAEAISELAETRQRYQTELSAARTDLTEEASNREEMVRRLSELRTELERLQAENAAEWEKRERFESEKISLERENKKLKSELRELREMEEFRRGRPVSASVCPTVDSCSQRETIDRSGKEFTDLKHSYTKLKKILAEKTTELSHALRRSERYEAEVKRVRSRVDELKRELAGAQDEVDAATNSARRLQRANEDLVEQLESANVQIEHFKNSTENCVSEVGTETTDGRGRGCDDDDDDDDEEEEEEEEEEAEEVVVVEDEDDEREYEEGSVDDYMGNASLAREEPVG